MWGPWTRWAWGIVALAFGLMFTLIATRDRRAMTKAWKRAAELGVELARSREARARARARDEEGYELAEVHLGKAETHAREAERLKRQAESLNAELRRGLADDERARRFNARRRGRGYGAPDQGDTRVLGTEGDVHRTGDGGSFERLLPGPRTPPSVVTLQLQDGRRYRSEDSDDRAKRT